VIWAAKICKITLRKKNNRRKVEKQPASWYNLQAGDANKMRYYALRKITG
jgi:hypothetical protein